MPSRIITNLTEDEEEEKDNFLVMEEVFSSLDEVSSTMVEVLNLSHNQLLLLVLLFNANFVINDRPRGGVNR